MLISHSELFRFFDLCVTDGIDGITNVILPSPNKYGDSSQTFFENYTKDNQFILDSYRTVDPAKTLYYQARELLKPENLKKEKFIIAGVKNCDLKAIEFMDRAIVKDTFVDPNYKHWRDNAFIISTDCNEIGETCHCNLLDGQPHPESGFDLNLSKLGDDYYITIGSDKGKALIESIKSHATVLQATAADVSQAEKMREDMLKKIKEQNIEFERNNKYEKLEENETEFWEKEGYECVGCGACTNICPTCYCLILNDESTSKEFAKVRSYDSCQYNGYARVAGGGTPREFMHQRFRNRYLCKLIFTKSNFDRYGCTGCGRCTQACPGEIDFRKVIKNGIGIAKEFETVHA